MGKAGGAAVPGHSLAVWLYGLKSMLCKPYTRRGHTALPFAVFMHTLTKGTRASCDMPATHPGSR